MAIERYRDTDRYWDPSTGFFVEPPKQEAPKQEQNPPSVDKTPKKEDKKKKTA